MTKKVQTKEEITTKTFEQYRTNELTRVLPEGLIDFNSWNPNDMDDQTFERLVSEMREIGRLIDPIQVVPKTDGRFMVIGGAHRLKAARVLGWAEVPATLLTEAQWEETDYQKFATVKLNMIKGKLTPEKMARLYTEMADKYGADSLQQMFAITDTAVWESLVKGVSKSMKKALPKPLGDKFDALAKDAKSASDLGLIINQLMTEYGDTVNQNFLVFTFGGKEHLYINMSEETRTSMKKVLGYCTKYKKDINDVLAEVTKEWVKAANKLSKLAAKEAEEAEDEAPPEDLNATGAKY